ncbi:helix-turn-helix transcriptional regulator [Streptomyces sp. NPDC048518]|uniref:helix-turn-helix domain-containing protein n=1 Tax=Streptomyces sp. NPDC048518 TaxID=3155029 RepID=UPI0033F35643
MPNRSPSILAEDQGLANERLRAAMVAANVTTEGLADHLGIDPKSVDRWITTTRIPHARNAHAVAKALRIDPYYLWPMLDERHRSSVSPRDELMACYPSRGAVPHGLWRGTLLEATSVIDLAISNPIFLTNAVFDLHAMLVAKTEAGVRVRIAGPAAGQGVTLVDVFPSLADVPGIKLVTHPGLRADLYRADEELLVTTPVDGLTPALSPVLHLRRVGPAPLTAGYLTALDHIFETATPVEPADAR